MSPEGETDDMRLRPPSEDRVDDAVERLREQLRRIGPGEDREELLGQIDRLLNRDGR